MILPPPGAVMLDVHSDGTAVGAAVTGVVSPRIELTVSSSSTDPLGLEAKLVLVEDLVPLIVAATAGTDGLGMIATLFFGPVRIDAGRTWGRGASRWGTAQLSVRPELTMLFGADASGGRFEPYAGVRFFPSGHGLWEIDLTIGRYAFRASISAVAW
jgi:hypothetical protein